MSSFDLQPILQGGRVVLRPLEADDFECLYAVASDPLIWEQHPQWNRYQREVFVRFFEAALESHGAFVIKDRANDEVIGSSRFYDLQPDLRRVTVGYTFLSRRCWGAGFNREMKTLMLEHAFRFVDSVYFEIGEKNIRSQKAIARIGARQVDRQILDGVPHLIFRIAAAEFRSSKSGGGA